MKHHYTHTASSLAIAISHGQRGDFLGNHHVVEVVGCESGQLARDGLRRSSRAWPDRESLRENQVRLLSDWGSIGRKLE